ncbi:MAG: bacterial Ig-like domain-containing protein [Bacteroidales bacterium]|nr:bacterial Ig-like domain-containing protein [Bacteroidales bacterium]
MKNFLLKAWLMLICLLAGVGTSWADTVKSTFTSNKWAVGEGEPEWVKTGANATSFESASPSRGVQTTLTNIKSSGLSLTNSTIKELGTIKSVTLVVSANGAGGSVSGVKVGDTDFMNGDSKTYSVGNSAGQTVTFANANGATGDIVITFTSTATSKSLYVKSIEVTYEGEGGGSNPDPTTYTVTVANNITGGTVSATPTKAAANATVTLTATPAEGYEFGAWDVKDASSNIITVTDNKFTMPAANVNVSATFNEKTPEVVVRPDNEIFYESFDTNDGTGGNDGSWSGNIASNTIKQDNDGWVYANGSGADACAKFGTGSSLGTATTPAMGQACDATLTFKAAAWNGSSEKTTLKLSVIGGGTISPATVTMTKGAWSTFTATLTGLTADSKVKFEGNSASNSRFFLDEVSVVKTGNATPVKTVTSIAVKTAPTKVAYTEGDKFAPAGLVITATYNMGDPEDVAYAGNESKFSFEPSLTTALTTENTSVTITYEGKTTTQAISVEAFSIANTQQTAYTVAEAIALIDADKGLSTPVYVKGKVSEIVTEFNEQYGNITFNISEDGTTSGQQFQFYRNFKGADKTKWTAEDVLPSVGDDVIGYGTLKKYVKDTQVTYEFNEGNYIVDLNSTSLKPIAGFIQTRQATVNANELINIRDYIRIPEDAGYNDYSITTSIGGLTQKDGEFVCIYSNVTFLKAGTYTVDVKAPEVKGLYAESTGSIEFTVEMDDLIESITIEGTPTKITYYTGESFDLAGLKVMANYLGSGSVDVTKEAEFTFDPVTFTEIGNKITVQVLAAYDDETSEVYTYDVSVEKNPYVIADGFTETSGNIDENVSYEAFKGNDTSDPAIPTNTNYIRLYQNGGYITISGAKGVTISEVILTTGSTYASTTIGTAIDDADAPTSGTVVAKNSDYTVGDLNCNSISFYCLGADKNTRLDIAAIKVKYTKVDINLASISVAGEGIGKEFLQNSTFNHEGITVTARYTDQSSEDVTAKAEFTEPDMTNVGEKTVEVSYTEGGVTKTTSYTINVVAESITELHIATLPAKTVFKLGESFSCEGLSVTADYNSGRKGVELEAADYEVVAPDVTTPGKKEVTVSLIGNEQVSTSYNVTVLPTNTIFFKSFDTNDGTGGNDDKWSGSIASNTFKSDNAWTVTAAGGADQCAKFGAGSTAGSAVTPALGHVGAVTVSFKAAAWNGNSEATTIIVSIDGNTASEKEITLTKGEWTDYIVTFTGLTAESKVKFAAAQSSNNRFFLDEVLITEATETSVGALTNYIEALKNGEDGYTLDGLQKVVNDILQIEE